MYHTQYLSWKNATKRIEDNQDIIVTEHHTYTIFIMYAYIKCCICEESLRHIDNLDCYHGVCRNCLSRLRKNECPICRRPLIGGLVTKRVIEDIESRTEIDKLELINHQEVLATLASYGIDINEIY